MNDDDEIPEFDEGTRLEIPAETHEVSETLVETPVSPQSQEIVTQQEVPPETVEIAEKNSILGAIEPQDNKYWHFRFKNEANQNKLTEVIQDIPGYNLTVEYGVPQNTPDITIKQGDKTVGKIHLLLCDRRDANIPEKYYCKIYFYHFYDQTLFETVKAAIINFFERFRNAKVPPKEQGGAKHRKRAHRTHKKRRVQRRKKTMRKN